MMNNWRTILEEVDTLAETAGKQAGLPSPAIKAFDGDVWIRSWRKQVGTAFVEVQLRLRPDAFEEGLEAQISARAWMAKRPDYSWVRTFSTQYWSWEIWDSLRQTLEKELVNEFSRAWKEANKAAPRLPQIRLRRQNTLKTLRDKKLL